MYERQELYDKAREYYEQAYACMIEVFAETDKRTLSVMSDLALCYDIQEEKDKAIEMYLKCYELHKNEYGVNNQLTISVYYNLGCLYYDQQKYDLAMPIMTDCYERRVIALGKNHISSLDIMHAIASLYGEIGNEGKAYDMFVERVEIYRQFYGSDSKTTLYEIEDLVKWLFIKRKCFNKLKDMLLIHGNVVIDCMVKMIKIL